VTPPDLLLVNWPQQVNALQLLPVKHQVDFLQVPVSSPGCLDC
jgi:hypothetical protein